MAFALFVVYLMPWIAAVAREHEHHGAVLAANLLLGWTGIGWLAVLAYALRSVPRSASGLPRPQLRVVPGGAGPSPEP